MKEVLKILKALSDENRLKIVILLKVKPLCVCELKEVLPIAGSTLSAHLKLLYLSGIIDQNKSGRWIEYFLTDNEKILNLIESLENFIINRDEIDRDKAKVLTLTKEICTKSAV